MPTQTLALFGISVSDLTSVHVHSYRDKYVQLHIDRNAIEIYYAMNWWLMNPCSSALLRGSANWCYSCTRTVSMNTATRYRYQRVYNNDCWATRCTVFVWILMEEKCARAVQRTVTAMSCRIVVPWDRLCYVCRHCSRCWRERRSQCSKHAYDTSVRV